MERERERERGVEKTERTAYVVSASSAASQAQAYTVLKFFCIRKKLNAPF